MDKVALEQPFRRVTATFPSCLSCHNCFIIICYHSLMNSRINYLNVQNAVERIGKMLALEFVPRFPSPASIRAVSCYSHSTFPHFGGRMFSVGVPLFNDATMVAKQSMIMGHLQKYAHRGEQSPRRVICLTDTLPVRNHTWTELVSNASFRGESRSKAFTHYNISVS